MNTRADRFHRRRIRQAVQEAEEAEEETSDSPSSSISITTTHNLTSPAIRMEEANNILAAVTRKKAINLHSKALRLRERAATQRANDTPDTIVLAEVQKFLDTTTTMEEQFLAYTLEMLTLESNPTAAEEDEVRAEEFEQAIFRTASDIRFLISQRTIASYTTSLEVLIRGLTTAYDASPTNDHAISIGRVSKKASELEAALESSNIPEEEELRQKGNLLVERAHSILGRVAGEKATDSKPGVAASKSKSHLKLKYIEVPTFSGKTEDWMGFFRLFTKAVHHNDDLDEDSKLTYLVQAIQDPRVKQEISERLDEPGAYNTIIKELEQTHDKPRWMHRKYTEKLRGLSTPPRTREGLMAFLSEGHLILNGLQRLKGGDITQILTSAMETTMDPATRSLWNQKTDAQKTTPPVVDLFAFLKDQADQLEDTKSRPKPAQKQKGQVHSVTNPHQRGSQGGQHQGHVNNNNNNQQQQSQRGSSQPSHQAYGGTPSNHKPPCPLCQQGHPMFYCPTFLGMSVPDRRDKTMSLKCCLNCLKPHHQARECNSSYRCKENGCGKKHNSLLHDERPRSTTPAQPQHVVAAAAHSDSYEEDEECLLMTARVTLLGPAGQITVRALLDSGSTISIVTEQLARQLRLKKTGKQVSISGIKSKKDTSLHPMMKVELGSEFLPSWRATINVATLSKVIRKLPFQDVPHVREMNHLKGLKLADSKFDQPGKIEVLLGQNIWRHLFLDGKVKGSNMRDPEAWQTVFGWTVLGSYTSSPSQQIITHVSASVDATTESDALLARFQELEEPTAFSTPLTKKEERVEEHYLMTHTYDEDSRRYQVRLPRVENPPPLGESRTQAVNRAAAHERSIIRKGRYQQFQDVMIEYVTLGHAVEVTGQQPHPQPQASQEGAAAIGVAAPTNQSIRRGVAANGVAALPPQVMTSDQEGAATTGVAAPEGGATTGVAPSAITSSTSYYMPVHSVLKETSSTTKVRAVFDASARTTSHYSLNDILAVGPTLHPTIDKILLRFRLYPVALSSDIAKMYREVLLHPEDQPYHKYIWRASTEQPWKEYQMTRVTFGVAASPYLAVKTLQQVAADHGEEHPTAQWHVLNSFYVDDFLGGASSEEEATQLYQEISSMLEKGSFYLRKWRSSSSQVLGNIPSSIQETMPTLELTDQHSATYPKALGVSWDSGRDTMFTNIGLPSKYAQTKRGVISDIARTFDVLGWITPAILPMKIMFRELWKEGKSWDEPISDLQATQHLLWRSDLSALKEVHLPRCYFRKEKPSNSQLHGFADSSKEAYAAVVYLRATYPTLPPSIQLVVAKSKVAPLKTRTIPQLELCAANLLARLLTTTGQTLGIPITNQTAYSDSTVVLGWLGGESGRYCVFAGHRIAATTILLPSQHWHHVPSGQNPADVASRGCSATELTSHQLWWQGPPWLETDPISLPPQPTQTVLEEGRKTEMKPEPKVVMVTQQEEHFETKQNSYLRLVRITSWLRRFMKILDAKKEQSSHLSTLEGQEATLFLLQRAQHRSFTQEFARIKAGQAISPRSKILVLHPIIGKDKLLRVGGRLWNTDLPYHTSHPIILAATDHLTRLLFGHYHLLLGHCGPSTLLTHAANLYHVLRGRSLASTICSRCITCRKKAAKASSQLMGQLPPFRVEHQQVFHHTGMDCCGPFLVRQGYTRKPVYVEVFLSIFICMVTKAVHLEVVSSLKTEAFIASLERFVARRGLPLNLHSDNGSNYVGAQNQLAHFYQMMNSQETKDAISRYTFQHQITWHNSPQRAPHFGGLWEAAVRSAKFHLKRIVGQERLTFEELTTVCCQIESFLNSRPLGPITSHNEEGRSPLTPSHFLIGRAARAFPREPVTGKPTTLERWNICEKATQDFWDRWSQEYLQQLQKATKWHHKERNFQVNDLVMLTDGNQFKAQWSMAKVVKVYPGRDGLVRAVDVQLETKVIPKTIINNVQLAKEIKTSTSILRRPITKLALLLAADELPGDAVDLDQPMPASELEQ